MVKTLSKLLEYTNSAVVTHFCQQNPNYTLTEGQQLLHDLLCWFWLQNERKKRNKATYLFGPLLILDELWHVFILHTRNYTDFCALYFAEYIHHDPEPIGFEHRLNEEELADYLIDCFNYLDPEWIERRFAAALTQDFLSSASEG